MQIQEIFETLKSKFDNKIIELNAEQNYITIEPQAIAEVCKFLHDDEVLSFDFLMCLTGVDHQEKLSAVYHLFSYKHRHKVTLKVFVDKDKPNIPTVENIWKIADWYEREAFDLLGIIFEGHSSLRRLLMPANWKGHPLRKDYQLPEKYQGIKLEREHYKIKN